MAIPLDGGLYNPDRIQVFRQLGIQISDVASSLYIIVDELNEGELLLCVVQIYLYARAKSARKTHLCILNDWKMLLILPIMLGPFGSLELIDPLSWGEEVLLTGLIF